MRIGSPTIALRLAAVLAVGVVAGTLAVGAASGDTSRPAGEEAAVRPAPDASFSPVFLSPLSIEGLTGDGRGNLYVAARGATPCPVWRIAVTGGAATLVGNIPAPCNPAGLAFGPDGRLFVTDGDEIHVLRPSAQSPPTATVFASGIAGANGVAFDRRGDLWVTDGGTGQGRVWRIDAGGVPSEVFRVQPMVNDVNVVGGVGGIGRDPRTLPPGSVTITPAGRAAADTLGSQHLVANGLAFAGDGTLFIADTARGAIWRVRLDHRGNLRSPVGCDTTFTPNTLCLDNVFVAHPFLEGVDGIALDRAGNIWGAVNERNAVVVVSRHGHVTEFFRNDPDPATRLRNGGPMEFPTSPFLTDRTLCLTHSDGSRRDNAPNSGGEVGPGRPAVAKINCLDSRLQVPGLPLPVR